MKCEICHQAPAEEALQTIQDGESVELYVCHKCADKERRKQKREKEPSSKNPPLGVTVSVEDIWIPGADNMPKAEMLNMVSDALQTFLAARGKIGGDHPPHKSSQNWKELGPIQAEPEFLFDDYLHLEGLNLIGEIAAVRRAFKALQMELTSIDIENYIGVGNVYRIRYRENEALARQVCAALIDQEKNARHRLMTDLRRVFADAVIQSLTLLQVRRLMPASELFDLLSPLRIAVFEGLIDGISVEEIDSLMMTWDLKSEFAAENQIMKDEMDAARADELNKIFAHVRLSRKGEDLLNV